MQPIAVTLTVLLVLPALGALGCACTRELNPVCGSDTRTYSNPCLLRCAREKGQRNLVEVHSGPCDGVQARELSADADPCACSRVFSPVCGTDGETYSNNCLLNCAKATRTSSKGADLAVAYTGACDEGFVAAVKPVAAFRPCICTFILHPVCGTDGRTYSNDCSLECTRRDGTSTKGDALAKAHTGACQDSVLPVIKPRALATPCPMLWAPICGTDDVTYDNKCVLEATKKAGTSTKGAELAVAHKGVCDISPRSVEMKSQMICTKEFAPVCGSDGKTYGNQCELNVAKQLGTSSKGAELAVAYKGVCDISPRSVEMKSQMICTKEFAPVCGSDGKTYGNQCELNVAKQLGTSSKGAELELAYKGICDVDISVRSAQLLPQPICPQIFAPVCGNDGKTYSNKCFLNAAKRLGTSSKGAELELAHTGECDMMVSTRSIMPIRLGNCPNVYEPVCGSNGVTYENSCLLRLANNFKPPMLRVHEVHAGACEAVRSMGFCPAILDPVCGSDGVTYDNLCFLEATKRSGTSTKGAELAMAYKGEC